jgi:uncharacterized protein YggE
MKTRPFLLLLAALVPLSLQAQATDSVISVNGSRTTQLVPDRASMFVLIEGTAETATDANARLETKLRALQEALRAFASRVESDPPISYGANVANNPNYPVPPTPTYASRSVMRVRINRIDQMHTIIAALVTAGAHSVTSIAFESSVVDSVRRARVPEVIAVARAEAELLAAGLGGRIGKLISANLSGNASYPTYNNPMVSFDNRYSGNQLTVPALAITTTVTLSYRLSPR